MRGLFGKIEVDYKAINLDEVRESLPSHMYACEYNLRAHVSFLGELRHFRPFKVRSRGTLAGIPTMWLCICFKAESF